MNEQGPGLDSLARRHLLRNVHQVLRSRAPPPISHPCCLSDTLLLCVPRSPKVVVVGSTNVDLIAYCPKLPRPGEERREVTPHVDGIPKGKIGTFPPRFACRCPETIATSVFNHNTFPGPFNITSLLFLNDARNLPRALVAAWAPSPTATACSPPFPPSAFSPCESPLPIASSTHSARRDRYRRTLAYVELADGRLLNEEIIRQGYGHAYTKYPFNPEMMERFRAAERYARARGLGLWARR